jgi:hypothetical protein
MKIIITESRLKELMISMLPDNFPEHIEELGRWNKLEDEVKEIFYNDRGTYEHLIKTYGPIYELSVEGTPFIIQNQGDKGWFISPGSVVMGRDGRRIIFSERDFFNLLGLEPLGMTIEHIKEFGISLQQIIDDYFNQ